MKVEFKNEYLKYLFLMPIEEMKGKQDFAVTIIKQYQSKVRLLFNIKNVEELRKFKGLNFEYLKGDRKGKCSLRLNDQYRMIFEQLNENEITIILINEISKHYE
jgi:proteic killer suppression protein